MQHKFLNHSVSPKTRFLILGTFHPDIENEADFFYGRSRNYLWRILPACFDHQDLKNRPIAEKKEFMNSHQIDFVDIIASLNGVEAGQEANYEDKFIDSRVHQWVDVVEIISTLKNIEAVYFTRKTFSGIPNIEQRLSMIRNYCAQKCIRFCLLETPSRYSSQEKTYSWKRAIIEKTTCL